MYYTAVNRLSNDIGDIIWRDGGFVVREFQHRYSLIKDGYAIAELISGKEGLQKYYKGDFKVWIEKVRAKDLKKAEKIEKQAKEALSDANFIREMWKG